MKAVLPLIGEKHHRSLIYSILGLKSIVAKFQPVVRSGDLDRLGVGDVAAQDLFGQWILEILLDGAPQRVIRHPYGPFAGYAAMVYDPFPLYGHVPLAENHSHRAVTLGFGLEVVEYVAYDNTEE